MDKDKQKLIRKFLTEIDNNISQILRECNLEKQLPSEFFCQIEFLEEDMYQALKIFESDIEL